MNQVKRLTISGQLLMQMLREGLPACEVIADPLPADARIESVDVTAGGDLTLVIASKTFPQWNPLTPIPELRSPSMRRKKDADS